MVGLVLYIASCKKKHAKKRKARSDKTITVQRCISMGRLKSTAKIITGAKTEGNEIPRNTITKVSKYNANGMIDNNGKPLIPWLRLVVTETRIHVPSAEYPSQDRINLVVGWFSLPLSWEGASMVTAFFANVRMANKRHTTYSIKNALQKKDRVDIGIKSSNRKGKLPSATNEAIFDIE